MLSVDEMQSQIIGNSLSGKAEGTVQRGEVVRPPASGLGLMATGSGAQAGRASGAAG